MERVCLLAGSPTGRLVRWQGAAPDCVCAPHGHGLPCHKWLWLLRLLRVMRLSWRRHAGVLASGSPGSALLHPIFQLHGRRWTRTKTCELGTWGGFNAFPSCSSAG